MVNWLPSLVTDTPEEGFELAILLARNGVHTHKHQQKFVKNYVRNMLKMQIV